MFRWFRKKKAVHASETSNSAIVDEQQVVDMARSAKFGKTDYEVLLKAFFRSGVRGSFYFAKCAGLDGSVLSEDNKGEYVRIVLSVVPEDISLSGRKVGFKHFENELISALKSDHTETILQIEKGNGRVPPLTHEEQEVIKELSIRSRKSQVLSLTDLFAGFDLIEATFDYVCHLRQYDLELMLAEINKRQEHLLKIFRPMRHQSVNKYGDLDEKPALDEMEKFLDYAFEQDDFRFYHLLQPLGPLVSHINNLIDDQSGVGDIPENGIEFEHWCADNIKQQGWQVSVSSASGDQGVDVVAERSGTIIAVQCKRYSNPIGNKAVQEAFTGGQNVGAGHSCVVGTGGFTRAAVNIADKTGVKLLDAANIGVFSQEFGFESVAQSNADTSSIGSENDDDWVSVNFSGTGGCFMGTLLRSSVNHNNSDQLGLRKSTAEAILGAINKDTGSGEISVPRDQVAMLFYLGAVILNTKVELNEYNVQSMSESQFYDQDEVSQHAGESVMIRDLVRDNVLEEMYGFVRHETISLGPVFQSFVAEEIIPLLEK